MGGDVEERLRRIEEMLRSVLERLEALEAALAGVDEAAARAVRLAALGWAPVAGAVEAALRFLEAARSLGARLDPVTEALLEALSTCEPLSVSEAARRVRALRGQASRTTVRKRLAALAEAGVVRRLGEGPAARYVLSSCPGAGGGAIRGPGPRRPEGK